MKICTMCGLEKPVTEYHSKKRQPSGLNPACKACVSAKGREYYAKNADAVKGREKAWREANIELARERAKQKYEANPLVAKERAIRWASENQERRKEIAANSAERHREARNERQRIAGREFRRLNPAAAREEGRMRAALRRSREQDAGVNIDRSDWKALIDLFEVGTCIYCGTDGHKLTMDHWMPVSLGGKTEVGNLIPCCKSCNSRKSNMHPIEWMKKAGINDDRGSGSITILEFLELTREAVIDVKGMDTPLSKFKRKCVKAQYGFDVEIVK